MHSEEQQHAGDHEQHGRDPVGGNRVEQQRDGFSARVMRTRADARLTAESQQDTASYRGE